MKVKRKVRKPPKVPRAMPTKTPAALMEKYKDYHESLDFQNRMLAGQRAMMHKIQRDRLVSLGMKPDIAYSKTYD